MRAIGSSCTLALMALMTACGDDPGDTPPTAVIVAPTYCDLGQTIELDGRRSTDPENDIIGFRFVLADGSATRSFTSDKVSHTCKVEGLIGVTLFVQDASGHQDSASTVISVRPP